MSRRILAAFMGLCISKISVAVERHVGIVVALDVACEFLVSVENVLYIYAACS